MSTKRVASSDDATYEKASVCTAREIKTPLRRCVTRESIEAFPGVQPCIAYGKITRTIVFGTVLTTPVLRSTSSALTVRDEDRSGRSFFSWFSLLFPTVGDLQCSHGFPKSSSGRCRGDQQRSMARRSRRLSGCLVRSSSVFLYWQFQSL